MTNVLVLTSSPRGEAAHSTNVATELAGKIENAHVTVRDLCRNPLPHITPAFVHAMYTPEKDRTPQQRDALALSDELVAELTASDVVIIAAGLINFGEPSTLKAWIDHVSRAGQTFRYSESGPVGLLKGKKAILVLAMGGVYSTGPMASFNHLEPHLRSVLGFLGITDIETVLIEGVGLGEEALEKALGDARARVDSLAVAV